MVRVASFAVLMAIASLHTYSSLPHLQHMHKL